MYLGFRALSPERVRAQVVQYERLDLSTAEFNLAAILRQALPTRRMKRLDLLSDTLMDKYATEFGHVQAPVLCMSASEADRNMLVGDLLACGMTIGTDLYDFFHLHIAAAEGRGDGIVTVGPRDGAQRLICIRSTWDTTKFVGYRYFSTHEGYNEMLANLQPRWFDCPDSNGLYAFVFETVRIV